MMKKKWLGVVLVFALFGLTACALPGDDWLFALALPPVAASAGDPGRGEQLFRGGVGEAPPCSACHQVGSGGMGLSLGPNLAGVASRADSRVAGMTAEEYLVESILHPTNYIVPGYRVSMFDDYAAHLSEQNVHDLAAYLLTLTGEQ